MDRMQVSEEKTKGVPEISFSCIVLPKLPRHKQLIQQIKPPISTMSRRMLLLDGKEHDISNLAMRPTPLCSMYPNARLLMKHDVENIVGRRASPECPNSPPRTTAQERLSDTLSHMRSAQLLPLAPPQLVVEKTPEPQYKQKNTDLENPTTCDDYIKVSEGLILPLCSAEETRRALMEKRVDRHICLRCSQVVGCMDTARYVLCPRCRCIMRTGVGNREGYVALGFCYEKYLHEIMNAAA